MERLRRAYGDYEDAALQTQLNETQYNLVRGARPADLGETQSKLDNETAIIEYLYTEEKVFALVITRSSLRSVALPITKANLLAKVKLLRALIFDNAKANDDWQPVAEDLHDILIEPIEQTGALKDIRKLGIVPFGFLHDLPFAALVRDDEKSVPPAPTGGSYQNHFLIEDYTLFHIPSSTFLTRSIGQTKSPEQTLLSFGINDADDELPLRFAEEEATTVATLFNEQAFVNTNATETELKKLAPHFKYIHLATHAVSEPMMPLLSRLKLKSTAEDDGNLTVREIFNLQLNADLVTLGACRTGQSFPSSGNQSSEVDRMGLSEAFLHAGTRSVVATLFPIEDRSTPEFMRSFYTNLRTQDKAEALAATQRAALRGQLSYSTNNQTLQLIHPRHWAAFILVGDYK
jgi:CHAT domain-containing protein